jgi:hypothetical protein
MFDAEPAIAAALGPVTPRAFFGSGLTRPEQYDWRTKWPQEVAAAQAQVAVILLGVWDARDVTITAADGAVTTYTPGTAEWETWYRGLVTEAMALLFTNGVYVVWVLPMDEIDPAKNQRLGWVRTIIRQEMEQTNARRGVAVDGSTPQLFGKKADGEHLCAPAAERVAFTVRAAIEQWRIVGVPADWATGPWRANARYAVSEGCAPE